MSALEEGHRRRSAIAMLMLVRNVPAPETVSGLVDPDEAIESDSKA